MKNSEFNKDAGLEILSESNHDVTDQAAVITELDNKYRKN